MTVMDHLKRRSWVLPARWAAMCAATVLAGCAHVSQQTPEALVQQRANERWQALVAGQFDKAYTFNTPGFRSIVTPESYHGRIGNAVKWVAAKVTKVNCNEADKCDVQIQLDYQPFMNSHAGSTYSSYPKESWVLEDGQWWVFEPVGH